MALSPYDLVAEKVLLDLEVAIRKDTSINEFDIIPVSEAENRNSSPIIKGECTLGLESWIIPHIYPFAHNQIMLKSNHKSKNLEKFISCLSGVALLNPEMSAVWSRRRELILSKRLELTNELRLTRMTLSRKPKSNEALSHRRWIISEIIKREGITDGLLHEELTLSEMIANRYHSNYHAWSHRIWSFQNLISDRHQWNLRKKMSRIPSPPISDTDIIGLLFSNIPKIRYMSIVDSHIFQMYTNELENNLKWVSCHVSDHSGFHFRKFLIDEIYNFLKVTLHPNNTTENHDPSLCNQSAITSSFFTTRKLILLEFLKAFKSDNQNNNKALEEYFTRLEQNYTLFDLILSIVVSELKSNHSLCVMFPGHEALWYYRRCIVYFLKQYIIDITMNSERTIISHQDKNGVPHKKDFKFDYSCKDDKLSTELSDFLTIIYTILIKNEEHLIVSLVKLNDNERFVRNYEHWLKYYLNENIQSL